MGCFYTVVVQIIILFGSETWVVMPNIKHLFGGFHHKVERRIPRKISRRQVKGALDYLPLQDAIRAAEIEEIETYISIRKNMVAQYIATCPILELCLDMGRRTG